MDSRYSSNHGPTTHSNLRLRDAADAHTLFQAVRQGHFELIRRRLNGPEQQRLQPGHVYVWADREGALERWTDGHNWSPSRVRGAFLMYDEMPEPPEASFLRRKKVAGEKRLKQPRKKRLPPLPGGLSKQTYSATLMENGKPIQKWHLTAYFTDTAAPSLLTVDDDPILSTTVVPPNTFVGSMTGRRKSKSSKVSEEREDAEANFDSAANSLIGSPVEDYENHTSHPFDFHMETSHSSQSWETAREPSADQYDDGNASGGSGGSASTIRDELGRQESISSHPPISPVVDHASPQNMPPLHHWGFSSDGDPVISDERRGSLASVNSTQSSTASTSTSTSISTTSSRLYASSATSGSSQSPTNSWNAYSSTSPVNQFPNNNWNSLPSWPNAQNTPNAQRYPIAPASSVSPNSSNHIGQNPHHISTPTPSLSGIPTHLQSHPSLVPSALPPAPSYHSRQLTSPGSSNPTTGESPSPISEVHMSDPFPSFQSQQSKQLSMRPQITPNFTNPPDNDFYGSNFRVPEGYTGMPQVPGTRHRALTVSAASMMQHPTQHTIHDTSVTTSSLPMDAGYSWLRSEDFFGSNSNINPAPGMTIPAPYQTVSIPRPDFPRRSSIHGSHYIGRPTDVFESALTSSGIDAQEDEAHREHRGAQRHMYWGN